MHSITLNQNGGGGGEEEGDPTNRRGRRSCPGGRTHVLKTIINMCFKVSQKNIYYDYIVKLLGINSYFQCIPGFTVTLNT